MKTTIEISDPLLAGAKRVAARDKTTRRALIEAGLRRGLKERRRREPFRLRDARFRGTGQGANPRGRLREPRRMIAVDTNLLVYAHRLESEWHDRASERLRELAEGTARWTIPWPCLYEFLAIVTHPRIFATPPPSRRRSIRPPGSSRRA